MSNEQTHIQIKQSFTFEGIKIEVFQNKVTNYGDSPWKTHYQITSDEESIAASSKVGKFILSNFQKSPLFEEIINVYKTVEGR